MIGIVVVSHGKLALDFISATEHVVGKQENIRAICIEPDDDVEKRREDIIAAVKEVDTGKGVAVLTDMFGGTPSNLAISIMGKVPVEVIAGVNLPLLVKLASIRSTVPITEAVSMAQEAGRKYINVASNLLSMEPKKDKVGNG
ncbi:MAG TPA: PTS sugar transporter subunit IIA [Rickettsiales bacterium]|nr:PTS sugar transporter subunit IIA [Rickettsiales bacterium]